MNTGNKSVDKHLNLLLDNCDIKSSSDINVRVTGNDPVMDTPWCIGEAAATALSAQGVAVSEIWKLRKGENFKQDVSVDISTAALSTKRCGFMKQNGFSIPFPDIDYPTVGIYKAKDNRHVFINGGFPGLRRGILKILNCPDNKDSIASAILNWNAEDLEREAQKHGFCCVVCRTSDEWLNHEHGKALFNALNVNGTIKPVTIEKICDGEPQSFSPFRSGDRPLSNINVLDLTHVLAGPTCGMMLAEQGANVMRVNGPQIPVILPFVMDTGHGKLNAQIDLKSEQGRAVLWNLIENGADIFSESYRPGKFSAAGFSPKTIAEKLSTKKKGIIYVSINCYDHIGPWKDYPGWEQLAQATTGLACEQGKGGAPELLPTFPNDYMTGYLAAYGALAALVKRHNEGGSYHVKVSLCATAMWLQNFGKVDANSLPPVDIDESLITENMINNPHTGYGEMDYFGHPIKYSVTKAAWDRPTVPIGLNKPEWPK